MLEIVYAHEVWSNGAPSIFLAGPSPRTDYHDNWRIPALNILHELNFEGAVFNPLPRNDHWLSKYDAQIDWEIEYLEKAKAIAFWIPRDLKNLPGFTTNVEFGIHWKSGKFVLGYPDEAVKMRYLHCLAEKVSAPIRHTLRETLETAIEIANAWPAKTRFTS